MYLKSLTLRGFKSFASATSLAFEPGITCVVGPNGSGKSNVVDAIAWVMGEQGAKTLRGGKMEDVIFAGTSGRAPLGRAEVALTIDNTDGALPIDYTEVTITRTMFRNGGSEYAINGEGCRLLDVQELLSDSGIGREMHVIVGQGRLDAILHATPEERRGFIEEAAGVLKHRKRKEKALRKLDALAVNLTRLSDLTTELRRQLKPLGRQAELARRAQVIQADLRDAKLRLLADDVVTLTTAMAREAADEAALLARRNEVEAALGAARTRELELEDAIAADAPAQAGAQEAYVALTRQRERFAGLRSLAAERLRASSVETESDQGPAPEKYEQQAAEVRAQADEVGAALAEQTAALAAATEARGKAERALQSEEVAVNAARRAAADRREGLARLRGKVGAAASRVEARGTEIDRLTAAIADARARAGDAAAAQEELALRVGGLDEGEEDLDADLTAAEERLGALTARVEQLRATEAELRQRHAALQARAEALRAGLQQRDGSAALLAAEDRLAGLLGTVASLIRVRPGYETALGAALGAIAEAVAVADLDAAAEALAHVAAGAPGRAHLLIAGAAHEGGDSWPPLPAGAVYAADVVEADEALRPALRRVLRRTAVVDDIASATSLVAEIDVVAVTRAGEVLGRGHAAGGSSETLVEVQAAVAQADAELSALGAELEAAGAAVAAMAPELAAANEEVEAALEALHESDARMAAVAEELGALGGQVRGAEAEAARLETALAAATSALAADQATVAELEARLRAAEVQQAEEVDEPDVSGIAARKADVEAARAAEVEARLGVRTAEERHRTLSSKVAELTATARAVRARRERQAAARRRRQAEARAASEVLRALDVAEPMVAEAAAAATAARQAAEQQRTARDAELRELRGLMRGLTSEADKLNDSVHRDELAKAQQRLRIETAQEKALAEFGVAPDILVAEYGPAVPVPPSAVPAGDADDVDASAGAEAVPYVRGEQEARARKAERELAALGRVNPLALEEFAALQERQAFLTEQLEDLKKGKQDLIGIIAEVDDRVREVFAEAYKDVAEQFEGVFSRLFPGGEGRLILTQPDDMLATGVEVEARPPGKRIKRLSLLSGGERSLTAVAFLVALFKARPSPFYLLDEVEAALDDVNLGRLLAILEELRATSQLLVITHQKRTMEIADALYGVTMRDGVTQVISQRLRETV